MIKKDNNIIKDEIMLLVEKFYANKTELDFIPGKSKVSLMEPSYNSKEVNQVIDSLLSTRITLNDNSSNKVIQFENSWAKYIDVKNSIMVNSGSSANLLALFALANPTIERYIKPGDEIITPAVTWHTTISPIFAVGAVPVLIDVKLDDCTIDISKIEQEITSKTKAIMPVHLLGNASDMDSILFLAKKYNLYVIEDTCEAHGSEFNNRKCGGLGDVGTFSFFFSHHITTMEGGIITSNNDKISELCRIMRSQGVIRNTKSKEKLTQKYRQNKKYRNFDPNYLFANIGFNLRPTELNGGFGLEQIKKIDMILNKRRNNGKYWTNALSRFKEFFYFPTNLSKRSSLFCFPLIIKKDAPFSRNQFSKFLNSKKIENRPIMAGNVQKQPALKHFNYRSADLRNSNLIHDNGLFWGNHQGINTNQREYVVRIVEEFMNSI